MDGKSKIIEYEPAKSADQINTETIDQINSISLGINEISRQQLEALNAQGEPLNEVYEQQQDVLEDTRQAGNNLKEVAVTKAKNKKSKLMYGMAGVGAVVGTVASGGAVAIGLIAGVTGGAIGRAAGKRHVKKTQ